jgi:hypothetical protein
MLAAVIDDFDEVLASGTNPQKKHLLRRLVKKVLIENRHTVEVWYGLPNRNSVRMPGSLAPRLSRNTNRNKIAEPEVWFRIVHVTPENNSDFSDCQEQTVEIALGPKGAFENGNIGVIKRRVPPDGVVNALPPQLSKPRPQKTPRTPRVAELLRKAIEWKELLESGKGVTQADIARREGLSRARVTQIMDLLNLAPDIREYILSMPETVRRAVVTERALRPIKLLEGQGEQL